MKRQDVLQLDRIYENVFEDASNHFPSGRCDLERDFLTLRERFSAEGVQFLTMALPRFGSAFRLGLNTGTFTTPAGFKTFRGAQIPAFLRGITTLVFHPNGEILDQPDPRAISLVLQICFLVYKLDVPSSPKLETSALDGYVSRDAALAELELPSLDREATLLQEVFEGFDPFDVTPRHGPGAVYGKETADEKWETTIRLVPNDCYPTWSFFFMPGSLLLGSEHLDRLCNLSPVEDKRNRVVMVPKDSRGPRIIAIEMKELQYLQQGLGRKMVCWLESQRTRAFGRINFTDQTVNQELAKAGSEFGYFATLDLKDASDRVSLDLVRKIFRKSPDLLQCLEELRSSISDLPDGREIPLMKFAAMGSALCFPVESVVFWVISYLAVLDGGGSVREAAEVFVYGDDIIVPTAFAPAVVARLESVGLLVNRDKSCVSGQFRESCGVDAFDGVNVTPVKIRKSLPSKPSGELLLAWVSYANALYARDYIMTARAIRVEVEKHLGALPLGTPSSPFLCWHSDLSEADMNAFNCARFPSRWNKNLHRTEIRTPGLRALTCESTLDGWDRMLRNLTAGAGDHPDTVPVKDRSKVVRCWSSLQY